MNVRTSKVWNRLGQWYGTRWFDLYGTACPSEWARVINRTDDKRLDVGLMAARRASQVYPFTLEQLEAAIPRRQIAGEKPVAEQLVDHVKANITLCHHQTRGPWSFFYRSMDDGSRSGSMEISGVTIEECEECGCLSHRVRAEELSASRAGVV